MWEAWRWLIECGLGRLYSHLEQLRSGKCCSDEGRCGFGARRAICDRAKWNRCSQSLGPLVALLQHGMRMAMRTRLLHSASSLWMWRAEGRSFRPMRSGGRPLVALSTAARRCWRPGILSLTLGKLTMDSAPSGDRRGRCDRAAGCAARWQGERKTCTRSLTAPPPTWMLHGAREKVSCRNF